MMNQIRQMQKFSIRRTFSISVTQVSKFLASASCNVAYPDAGFPSDNLSYLRSRFKSPNTEFGNASVRLRFMASNRDSGIPTGNAKQMGYAETGLLFFGLSMLGVWLNAEQSHAEENPVSEGINLTYQPEAKSNIHTAKWRIFTDKARNLCAQGSFDEAEKYFYKALDEAKKGFGEQDPHVASCFNNLAELYRMRKQYDKAEPLYLEAVDRLRQSAGVEDGSVGFALHNLAGFYLLQRKLDKAQECYEEALKIKGRALGFDHPEYATTMFHLGEVLRLKGNVADGVALIRDSIRILEQIGLGSTTIAVKRLSRLSEILFFSGQVKEAEANQRKVVHVLEFSKDADAQSIISSLELLVTILLKQGKTDGCVELLQRCIEILRKNYGNSDVRLAASLGKLGGVKFQKAKSTRSDEVALRNYTEAEELLMESAQILERLWEQTCAEKDRAETKANMTVVQQLLLMLIRTLITLGDVRTHRFVLMTDVSMSTYRGAEEDLQRAMDLLEDSHVQEIIKPEVHKLHKECVKHLLKLQNIMSR